ncbi:hypothetical protein D9619_004769 [Psilocybe cf. subviscida]|uniref:Hydrophobin n=1 Tax=Psilocybe cf. subviscida TaxID=2480587 RepID=A0A8H5F853_9AGAR|nr:hypothetical protein D9619_004769 [Psilocybe cf. subviscida]
MIAAAAKDKRQRLLLQFLHSNNPQHPFKYKHSKHPQQTSAIMQFKLAALTTTLAIVTLAAATPTGTDPSNQCNTGSAQCCNSVQNADSKSIASLLTLLGIVAGSLTGQVGVTCSPITVIGASGTSCSAQPVCCTNNTFNGVVALGCTPININL